eukprot:jgi/Ulvmu1/12650/UM094_0006.1
MEAPMPRRSLGSTGLKVSVLGFGASPLGGVFQDIDEAEGIAAVHEAFKLGINFFDTSPFYGVTRSETVLGRALAGLPRDKIVVATKCGRYGPEEFDFSRERVLREFDASLGRLGLDYVDILQCHDIEFADLDQIVNETVPVLLELKESGRARNIGITGLPLKIYPAVLRALPPGSLDLCLSYCHLCLNDRSLLTIMPELQSAGVAVINASVLSMGLLTAAGPPPWHPAPPEVKEAAAKAAAAAKEAGQDISELALMWAFQEERVASTLVGMATRDMVRRNVATVNAALSGPLSDDAQACLAAIDDILEPVRDVSWPSGKPENN